VSRAQLDAAEEGQAALQALHAAVERTGGWLADSEEVPGGGTLGAPDAAGTRAAPASCGTMETMVRRAEAQAEREAGAAGGIAARAERTTFFLGGLRRQVAELRRRRKLARLSDCSISPETFEEGVRLCADLARLALEELRDAGALLEDGEGARQLDLLGRL